MIDEVPIEGLCQLMSIVLCSLLWFVDIWRWDW